MRHLTSIRHLIGRNLRHIPFYRSVRRLVRLPGDAVEFRTSEQYWRERYEKGGDSGEGSYGPLASYKAAYINEFCRKNAIHSAIEFGCGDGNQASMLDFRSYLGVDISKECIAWARKNLSKPDWRFETLETHLSGANETFDLGLSLDVIYHLIEDDVYRSYLHNLCGSASKYLLIYASNVEYFDPKVPHVRHRRVVEDVERMFADWEFVRTDHNPLAIQPAEEREYGSFADFHVFRKRTG